MTDNVVGILLFAVFSGVAQAVAQGAEPSVALIAVTASHTVLALGGLALIGFPVARHMNALALRESTSPGPLWSLRRAC